MSKRELEARGDGVITARSFGASVTQNITAALVVTILTSALVRIFNIHSTMASVILLAGAALTVPLLLLAASRGARISAGGFWVNVLTNIIANAVLLFIHPVNSWVKALPYTGAVAVALIGIPLILIALFNDSDNSAFGWLSVVALAFGIAFSLFVYGGFAQPGVKQPSGFGFKTGFHYIIYTPYVLLVTIAVFYVSFIIAFLPVALRRAEDSTMRTVAACSCLWVILGALGLYFFPWDKVAGILYHVWIGMEHASAPQHPKLKPVPWFTFTFLPTQGP